MSFATLIVPCWLAFSFAWSWPDQPAKGSAEGLHGVVASAEGHASTVGIDILKRGGNSVDAAVAVALALAVTFPTAGNLGGGGFMLVRMADGRSETIDYREVAPAAATRNMYLDAKGDLVPDGSLLGHKAAAVPGTVAGLALALERFGTMKWAEVVEPARKLADEGFVVSHEFAKDLRESEVLAQFPESRRTFLNDGRFHEEGSRFRQPELAATLQRLADDGPREFYEGRTARLIVQDMEANGGLITLEDLKNYKPVTRDPLRGTYREYTIITMPPPSSGGIALVEMLNILEGYDLAKLGHNSPEACHLLIEAMRRAFADRAEFLGDPDFVEIPTQGLTSKAYAKRLAETIDRSRATPSNRIGHGNPAAYESPQTTHFSIVDTAGNAVANTYTLNTEYGCGVTVRGAGFLLNNEMDDFTTKPGALNAYGLIQGERNAVAPRKRPLSSMTPTVVLKDRKLFLVVGSPGGPMIINTVLQVIINVADHGMNIQQAIGAPRIHHQWQPDTIRYEPRGLAADVLDALRLKGHRLVEPSKAKPFGDAQGLIVDPTSGLRFGASDRRGRGQAIGY